MAESDALWLPVLIMEIPRLTTSQESSLAGVCFHFALYRAPHAEFMHLGPTERSPSLSVRLVHQKSPVACNQVARVAPR